LFLPVFLILTSLHTAPIQPEKVPGCSYTYNKELKKNVYTQVEIEAEYPGGAAAFLRFINRNMRTSDELIATMVEDNISVSSVKMNFIVDLDGNLLNIAVDGKTDTSHMNGIEKEVFRLEKLMGKWKPGVCEGRSVISEVNRPMLGCIRLEMEEQ
jgi:hypothetical protein